MYNEHCIIATTAILNIGKVEEDALAVYSAPGMVTIII